MRMWIGATCLLLVACGKKDDVDVVAACEDACLVQADADGCDAAGVERECTQMCGLAASAPEDCHEALAEVYFCHQEVEWICSGDPTVTINGVAFPDFVDESSCVTESAGYSTCLGEAS